MSGGGAAVATLFELIPSITKLAGEIVSSTDATKRNAQLLEFQQALIGLSSKIASVQQENASLRQEKDALEAELRRIKDWDAQQARYQLVMPYSGVTAYAVKKSMSNGEAPHYLCANCFDAGKRSFLANSANKEGWATVVCSACKFTAATRWRSLEGPTYAEDVKATH